MLGPVGEAVRGGGVARVEQALDGAGEGGVLTIFQGELGGALAEGGVEAGGVGGEEVIDGGLGLAGAEPGAEEVVLGGDV